MANTLAPFGFKHIGYLEGHAPNFAPQPRQIAYNNATKIYRGDPVVSLSTGYIAQATAGTTQIAGIFDSCTYYSVAQGKQVWSNYWPGGDVANNAVITAYIISTPSALFLAQSNGTPIGQADIGSNVNFAIGTGSTVGGGFSGATIDQSTLATTNTLPFRIYSLYAGVGNGSDNTSNYNWAVVAFNNQDFKSLTGV
jgi:hypothetical protein